MSFLLKFLLWITLICKTVAVYKTYYVEDLCKKGSINIQLEDTGEESAGILQATKDASYSLQLHCRIMLIAPADHYVVIGIREVGLRINTDGSCKDYLEVRGVEHICHRPLQMDEVESYNSVGRLPSNVLELLYLTTSGLDNHTLTGYPGFTISFTALHRPIEGSCPGNSSFKCQRDAFCVWDGLRCDGHNNCGDLSDEERCDGAGGGSTVLVVLGVLIVSLMLIMCTATLIYTRNERVRRFSHRLRAATFSIVQRRPR